MRLIDADALLNETRTDYPDVPFDALCKMVKWFTKIVDEHPTIAASTWRRVEDELPDTPRMVIAYVDQWHIFAAYHSSRGEWKQADGFTVIGVTHWMPIEPPKEDA